MLIAGPFKKTSTASPSQVLCFRVCGCLLVHALTVFIQMRSLLRTIEPSNTAPHCCCPSSLTIRPHVSFDWTESQNHRFCAFVQSQPMVEKQAFTWMSEERPYATRHDASEFDPSKYRTGHVCIPQLLRPLDVPEMTLHFDGKVQTRMVLMHQQSSKLLT